jgi:hypothetical protein
MPARRAPFPAKKAVVTDDGRRNLVLVNTPGAQDRRDFEEIKALVEAAAPDIAVTIVDSEWPFPGIERELAKRRTLVFSPTDLVKFRPVHGRVYFGRLVDKMIQATLLERAGLPVPPATILKPDTKLDPAVFGDFVILKPFEGHQSRGEGVQLMRTERVRYMAPEEYPEGHPGRETSMIVQQFIDTGPGVRAYRVLTFFGEPLYAFLGERREQRAPLDASDAEIEASPVASNGGIRNFELVDDPDLLALARKVHDVAPGIPLKGIDFVRDAEGKLWILEFNGGGNTWAFSSDIGLKLRIGLAETAGAKDDLVKTGVAMLKEQFGAFQLAANILIDKTRQEAN